MILYQSFQPTLAESGLKRFGLSLKSSPSGNTLKGLVYSYLQITATKPTLYPVMPDATQAVFISSHGLKVGGAQLKANDIQILEAGEYFGIWFHPGVLRHFFDLNVSEITNQYVDSHYFPCRDFRKLHEVIYQCDSFEKRAAICERWLMQRYHPLLSTPFDHALALIYQSYGSIRISQLADLVGWSSRHLNRLFKQHTGLSTKVFTQIIRLQYACKQLYAAQDNSVNTTNDLGFFDQSHLIKDWNRFLLSNPGTFFNRYKSDSYNR